ncbi:hypothetical protein D3Z36_15915 [Lachnospiraceae bacterium]|nr:hypothetical protein [Lachnospiraceae bacterium]
MRKCRNCLCKTCMDACCDKRNCQGKKKECKRHSGFQQMSIFDTLGPKQKKAPRYPWSYYGISKQRYKELTDIIRSEKYSSLASSAAHTANKDIAAYILASIIGNFSYEGVEWLDGHRIPCGRTDFYGYRRFFYSIFDKELRRIGK